jgi:hypothetical protein
MQGDIRDWSKEIVENETETLTQEQYQHYRKYFESPEKSIDILRRIIF